MSWHDTEPVSWRLIMYYNCTVLSTNYFFECVLQNIVLVSLEEQTRLLNEALHKCVLYILDSEANSSSQNGEFLKIKCSYNVILNCRGLLLYIFENTSNNVTFKSFKYYTYK